ncbi:MAG TPA: phosphoribosylanthranilate isomerase [Pyrinomonadaceae bacterium]|jgi:phosphoribosylanthranilate isomerase|nr:phosphoribosylanthranilate isomerase [Pyrinomonadaceae bacterium]
MTKVKICGITNLKDALLAAKYGADALGFNFYERSPRYIEPVKARETIDQLPENILKVGVFVNEEMNKVVDIAGAAGLDAVQLHGEETPEFAAELKTKSGLEIIKAFCVSPDFKPEDILKYEVDAVLLDAYSPNEYGGTGEPFDWTMARKIGSKIYLAGGLSPENVVEAIAEVRPYAVDACSRLEVTKGVKDRDKVKRFIENVKSND